MAHSERSPMNIEELLPKKTVKIDADKKQAEPIDTSVLHDDVKKKILSLKRLLEKDPKAADLKWSLFIAACQTYRYDSCVKPFPPMYIKNETKDIDALRKVLETVPPLIIVYQELEEPNVYENYGPAIELLYWVLVQLRDPHIKSVNKECFDSVLRRVPSEMHVAAPNLIFQVVSVKQSALEEKWRAAGQGRTKFYAYHGSRLENFHSIVHYGLQQNMCKTSLFGTGIYLSSELGVSLPYSPVGYGWGGSILGSDMSCVALCELIDHPRVKRGDSGDNERSMVPDAVGGKVPNKYYVVENSELVRIRYLLVYSQEFNSSRRSNKTGVLAWFRKHKLLTFVLGYNINQENTKNAKSTALGVPKPTRRAALGEIGNKVTIHRGVDPIHKSSLLPSNVLKKSTLKQLSNKESEKTLDKPPVQVVKPVVKNNELQIIEISKKEVELKKEVESFSSDLLEVEDIDEDDKENPILVSIYSNDIYSYLRKLEAEFPIKKGFLSGQEVTPKMRCVLVDWLVEVHQQFRLMQETLYLTISIIDRFLQSFRSIDRKRLQLVGVTAMFIASKYEEMYSPDISDFVYITDNAYSKTEILQMEMLIVRTLNYSFGKPLPLHFLRRYSKAGKALAIHHTMAKYFLELSLVHYETCHYLPSLIAAAAIYLSFFVIGNEECDEGKLIWTNTLRHYTTFTREEVLPVVYDIASVIVDAEKSKYQAVRKKYTLTKNMRVSLRTELKSPTMLALAKKKQA
ncbi:uncharacterized protein LOC117168907 [Belonocnema kinseyi]|uniref:uncharacterized protein LOC117168907 n=1 Tax=Belonocnema kinseyi TaxID=2817044 RepID=UPI00143E0E1F|nr:uncharacterized protein LOC117168907 [Belonocnema kinseyi]